MTRETPEQTKKRIDDWAKDKEHWDDVRQLAGHLIHAEIIGAAHKQPTGTNYIRGDNDIDLDRLYADLVKFHPAVLAKLEKRQKQKPKAEPARNSNAKPKAEPVRDSINRALGKPVQKPQRESVRDSIERARSAVKGR
jgi:hypothetical protein